MRARRADQSRVIAALRFRRRRRRRGKPLFPIEKFRSRRASAVSPAKPRNALLTRVEPSIGSDETNQIIDESSLQPVIYRLASPRRRGTIGGGSTTGAPHEIVFGCKGRISVVHRIWTRKNHFCARSEAHTHELQS